MLLLQAPFGRRITDLQFSPDGRTLAAVVWPHDRLWLWDLAEQRATRALVQHRAMLLTAAFAPTGGRLATADQDGHVHVRDWPSGRTVWRKQMTFSKVSCLAFGPDGRTLAVGCGGWTVPGEVRRWGLPDGRELPALRGHRRPVTSLAFAPDGQTLATGGADRTLRLWDAATGRQRDPLFSLARFTGWLKQRLTGAPTQEQRTSLRHKTQVRGVTFSPCGRAVAAATGWAVTVWDLESGQVRRALKGHRNMVEALAFRPNSHDLATAGRDGTVRFWDVAAGRERAVLDWKLGRLSGLAFSADGLRAAVAGPAGRVLVWDIDE